MSPVSVAFVIPFLAVGGMDTENDRGEGTYIWTSVLTRRDWWPQELGITDGGITLRRPRRGCPCGGWGLFGKSTRLHGLWVVV